MTVPGVGVHISGAQAPSRAVDNAGLNTGLEQLQRVAVAFILRRELVLKRNPG